MSKYIKLEDAISKIVNTPTRVITDDLNALADRQHEIIDMLADLPTIEVSEEQLSKLKSREKSVENTTVSEDFTSISRAKSKLEVSEDAISREWVKENMLKYGFLAPDMTVHEFVEDAPSVVPSRAEGEWYRQTTDHFDYWECSECGMGVGLDDIKNYCPNCGSKMKG